MVKVNVKWGKQKFEGVELDTSKSIVVFKEFLYSKTGVPIARMKLMTKGSWRGNVKDDINLAEATFKDGQLITLVGSSEGVPEKPKEEVKFVEDMTDAEVAKSGTMLPAGLVNLGNTCYMNSMLQCLRYVPELKEGLTKSITDPEPAAQALDTGLGHLFQTLDASLDPVPPFLFWTALKAAHPRFNERGQGGGFKQQDSEEFQSELLQSLAQSLKAPTSTVPELYKPEGGTANLIDTLFGIRMESTFKCLETDAEPEVTKFDTARKLVCNITGGGLSSVKINHLNEGVLYGLEGEVEKRSDVLDRSDVLWKKTSRISRLPKYLAVQFMRFYWKATPDNRFQAGQKCKMMRAITFPADSFDVFDFCAPKLQKVLGKARDKYAAEALGEVKEGDKAESGEAAMEGVDGKAAEASAPAPTPAPAAAETAGEETMELDTDDLEAALAMSLGESGGGGGGGGDGAATDGSAAKGTSEPEAKESDLLGVGIPKDFRGTYELFGVVTHKGRDADGGHYIGWVRIEGDNWVRFDDDKVTPQNTEDILRLKGGGDWDMAYMAFYRAKA